MSAISFDFMTTLLSMCSSELAGSTLYKTNGFFRLRTAGASARGTVGVDVPGFDDRCASRFFGWRGCVRELPAAIPAVAIAVLDRVVRELAWVIRVLRPISAPGQRIA
jgi:hypothetical protein